MATRTQAVTPKKDDLAEFKELLDSDVESDIHETLDTTLQLLAPVPSIGIEADLAENPSLDLIPEVMDDFIRNFLFSRGMYKTLDTFQMEWYTLMDQGKLSKDDKTHVPDIYKQQELLHEQVDAIKRELAECQYTLSETKKIHERIAKERDHHRLHHTRLTQEKQKLADEIKELKKQLLEKEPLKKQAQQKFESLVKERTLMQLERDKLAQRVQILETLVPPKPVISTEKQAEKTVYEPPAKFQDRRTFLLPANDPKINIVETSIFAGQLNSMEVSHPHRLHDTVITTAKFHPKKQILATASDDRTWKLWSFPSFENVMTAQAHKDWISDIDFHPSGNILASGSGDHTVKLWDLNKGIDLGTLHGHARPVWSVCFQYTGQTLLSSSMDHTIRLWDVECKKILSTFRGHKDTVNKVVWKPMSNLFYTASADKTVGAWDARAGVLVHSLHGQHSRSITCLTVSQQGDKIAYAGSDGNVHVTDIRKWGLLSKWNVRSHVYSLEMDASGTTVACGLEFSLKLLRNDAISEMNTPTTVQALTFDKKNEHLIAGLADGQLMTFKKN